MRWSGSAQRSLATCFTLLPALLSHIQPATSIPLDLDDPASIRSAAATTASGLLGWYHGNYSGGTPGLLPGPYYWWEGGAMMMSLIDYWAYTGDATYNSLVTQGILWQVGPKRDFMTPNQTSTTGNDDQAFWAFAAMAAAENGFPNPPADQPQWLALAQAVFNLQAGRWDETSCAGGLKWQVFPFNAGYNYKNTISQGCFFNLASRLARYTGNATYAEWAARSWDWTFDIGLINQAYDIYDGTDDTMNCTSVNHIQWTYNAGVFLHGAANMYDFTNDTIWRTRAYNIITALTVFFPDNNNVMAEIACESIGTCNYDQRSFKGYLARWMAATVQLMPDSYDVIMPRIRASAVAAAAQCSGGSNGQTCGLRWTQGSTWDGSYGPGEQMSAMNVIGANLIQRAAVPLTNSTGGTSVGNPSAGSTGDNALLVHGNVSAGDKAGAGILTVLALAGILFGAYWMVK